MVLFSWSNKKQPLTIFFKLSCPQNYQENIPAKMQTLFKYDGF